jgi:hypothetical protein
MSRRLKVLRVAQCGFSSYKSKPVKRVRIEAALHNIKGGIVNLMWFELS